MCRYLVHSTYIATAENHIWTLPLKQHIRQHDLAHMLGGGNLFDEATEKGPACTTTAIAALGCQTLLSRVLLLELRCITLHKKHIATSLAIGTRLHTSRCSGICRVITNSWNIMHTHMHAIEEDINLKQLTGLIILGQALSSGPTSGQHLGTGMATFSCVRARRTGRRLHKCTCFYCMQFLVFIGEAIQWTTTGYPQGHHAEGN